MKRQEGETLYVPLRAVMEAMGYQADAADGLVHAHGDDDGSGR